VLPGESMKISGRSLGILKARDRPETPVKTTEFQTDHDRAQDRTSARGARWIPPIRWSFTSRA
jgi:hypothetical protein